MKKLIILFLGLTLFLASCGTQNTASAPTETPVPASAVIAEGHLVPLKDSSIAFQARGTVTDIPVKIGDRVNQGDVLARLGSKSDATYSAAQLELASAGQAYNEFTRNMPLNIALAWQTYMSAQKVRADTLKKWNDLDVKDIEDRMKEQQDIVDQRVIDLQDAQAEFDQYKDKPENDFQRRNASDKLISAQENLDEAIRKIESITRERDTVRDALDIAVAAENEAKINYDSALHGNTRSGTLVEQLALLKARLTAAQDQVNAFNIAAPFDGVVMDVNVAVGDQVGPETWAVKIADTSAWYVETSDLTELEVVKVAEGQKVSLVPDALPDAKMSGMVEQISHAFISQNGDVLYKVKIKVDTMDPRALWGMTVEVTFE